MHKDQNESVTHEEIYERLDKIEQQVTRLEGNLESLTKNTQEVLKAFQTAKGAFDALEWIAKVIKPVMVIAGAVIAVIAYVKGIK